MSYIPRSEILARLEDEHAIRLISADVIHTVDLQALWALIAELKVDIGDSDAFLEAIEDAARTIRTTPQ